MSIKSLALLSSFYTIFPIFLKFAIFFFAPHMLGRGWKCIDVLYSQYIVVFIQFDSWVGFKNVVLIMWDPIGMCQQQTWKGHVFTTPLWMHMKIWKFHVQSIWWMCDYCWCTPWVVPLQLSSRRLTVRHHVNLYSLENYRASLICSVLELIFPLFSLWYEYNYWSEHNLIILILTLNVRHH